MKQLGDSFISQLKNLISTLNQNFNGEGIKSETISKELACAALLMEVMKMDGELKPSEHKLFAERLVHHFKLTQEELALLSKEAEHSLEESIDYYQFTKALNQQLSLAEKLDLVESLWMMAAVDGHIDAHENHLLRKIADLLHIRNSEFTAIKDKVLK
jgi:uncharacterized tellurite resistance protein B-like protein